MKICGPPRIRRNSRFAAAILFYTGSSDQREGDFTLTESELSFFLLCAPLEDAIQMIDAGQSDRAKALLERILKQAKEKAEALRAPS